MSATALIGGHRHALDVTGAQGPAPVQEPPLDHRGVPDHLVALPDQRVHAAEGVLPVVLGHLRLEHGVEQGSRRLEVGGVEVGGMGSPELRHVALRYDRFPGGVRCLIRRPAAESSISVSRRRRRVSGRLALVTQCVAFRRYQGA